MINKKTSVRYEVSLNIETKKQLEKLSKEMKVSKRKILENIIDQAYHALVPLKSRYTEQELKRLREIDKLNIYED